MQTKVKQTNKYKINSFFGVYTSLKYSAYWSDPSFFTVSNSRSTVELNGL